MNRLDGVQIALVGVYRVNVVITKQLSLYSFCQQLTEFQTRHFLVEVFFVDDIVMGDERLSFENFGKAQHLGMVVDGIDCLWRQEDGHDVDVLILQHVQILCIIFGKDLFAELRVHEEIIKAYFVETVSELLELRVVRRITEGEQIGLFANAPEVFGRLNDCSYVRGLVFCH